MIDARQVRELYAQSDPSHGYSHVLRVFRLAQHIAREESANLAVVETATLLHDIGRPEEARTGRCHAEVGAEMAREILAQERPTFVEAVCTAIAQHRYRADEPPTTLEAKVLYDADKLDSIGAIGVARAYAWAGLTGQDLWADVPREYTIQSHTEDHTPVHEFTVKLIKVKDSLHTGSGRALAEERHDYMVDFFARLRQEVAGQR